MIGRHLAHYVIEEPLGTGGMGEVYRAVDRKLGRAVALKVLPPEMAANPERLERFERETRAVAALNHPNIVTIYSVEEAEGLHFFTMELVDGDTLAAELPESGLTLKRFFALAIPLADALSAAHAQGITHRDLKPANVMISRDGRLKILDFGIAKLNAGLTAALEGVQRPTPPVIVDDVPTRVEGARTPSGPIPLPTPLAADLTDLGRHPASSGPSSDAVDAPTQPEPLTALGQILGTGPYMSPEQVLGLEVDPRSDVFTLGTLFFLMLTGELPFYAQERAELRQQILKAEPIDALPPKRLASGLREILRRCMVKRADARYGNAGEVRDALVAVRDELEQQEMLTSLSGTVETLPSELVEELRRASNGGRRWRRAGLAVGGVLTAVALIAAFLGPLRSRGPTSSEATATTRAASTAREMATDMEEREHRSLAVLFFQNLSMDADLDWMRIGLADMLITDLAQVAELDVVSTDRLYATLERLDLLEAHMLASADLRDLAEAFEVELLVVGSFVQAGDTLQIQVKLQDPGDGRILTSERRDGTGEGSLFAIIDELSFSVRRTLAPRVASPLDRDIGEVTTSSVEALRYYIGGMELHLASRDEEAISLFERAIEIDPTFASALLMLGGTHDNRGHGKIARSYTQRALEHGDKLPAHRRDFAEAKFYGAHWSTYGRAIAAYERILERGYSAAASSQLAILHGNLERFDEVVTGLEVTRQRGSTFASNYYFLASANAVLGRFDKGEQILQGYVRRYSENWYGHMSMGWFHTQGGDLEDARAAFSRTEELHPGEVYTQNGRWRMWILERDWNKAEAEAELMMASDDIYGRWRGVICLARTRLYQERDAEALELFARAAEVHPEPEAFTAMTHLWAAEILLELDEASRALELAHRGREIGVAEWPERRGLFLEAWTHEQLGEAGAAQRAADRLEALAAIYPNVVETRQLHLLAGLRALARGEHDAARVALASAESLLTPRGIPWHWHALPDHVPVWWALAELERRSGNPDAERRWLERIASNEVERIEFPIQWRRARERLGAQP